jgi:5'-nucleotidase
MSLETTIDHHSDYSLDVDFSAAGYFTRFFGQILLEKRLPFDVDVLKVDVPTGATPETPWEITRVARHSYYLPMRPARADWEQAGRIGYKMADLAPADIQPDTDVYALRFKQVVSVTPLSLDLTSRVEFGELDAYLRESI